MAETSALGINYQEWNNFMWDSYLIMDKKVVHNRTDIVIHDTIKRDCKIIDVAIPACQNVMKKEAEKITKYRDLQIKLQKCWNLKKFELSQ